MWATCETSGFVTYFAWLFSFVRVARKELKIKKSTVFFSESNDLFLPLCFLHSFFFSISFIFGISFSYSIRLYTRQKRINFVQISCASNEGRVVDVRSLQSSVAFATRRALRFRRCTPSCQYHLQGLLSRILNSATNCYLLIILILRILATRSRGWIQRAQFY